MPEGNSARSSCSRRPGPNSNEVDLSPTYDAVVVGSGAAGGMAVYVLTTHGFKVLLLEAGKYQDTGKILHSMEWPYDHPRRGKMPDDYHALTLNEYNVRQSPYAQNSHYNKVQSYVQGWSGTDYSKTLVVDEKRNPYTGTRYAWVRSRVVGGKTNIWGRLALRLSDYDFKAKDRDGYGENWPISYSDIEPYYDKVDLYLGISGHPEGLPYFPDSKFQRPVKLNYSEVHLRETFKRHGPCTYSLMAGVTTDGSEAQQVSQQMLRAWRMRPACGRLRHPRGLRFTYRPHPTCVGHRQSHHANERHGLRGHRR